MGENDRTFAIVESSLGPDRMGRYRSTNPFTAAKKAGKRLFNEASTNAEYAKFKTTTVMFVKLKETTRGVRDKTFYYKVTKTPGKGKREFKKADGTKFTIMTKMNVEVLSVTPEEFEAGLRATA